MKGINYITNDVGQNIALMIDLEKISNFSNENIEEAEDIIISELRKNSSKLDYKKARKKLVNKGLLRDAL